MITLLSIKKFPLTVLLIGACACQAGAEIYKIVDQAGRVTYTDTPPAEETADPLRLPAINQIPVAKPSETGAVTAEETVFSGYSVVNLVAPVDGSLVRYDQQNIVVQLALTPELQAGHFVQFYLDGATNDLPVAATSYAIGSLERGTHSVSARVVTAEGQTVANSQSVRVHVQRHFKRN
jgi:hypothetical protein